MKTGAIASRVSSAPKNSSGKGEKEYSFDTQEADCRAYAERNNITIAYVSTHHVESARQKEFYEREDLKEILSLIASKSVDAIILGRLDRLSRRVGTLATIWKACKANGVELHFANIGKADDTLSGKFLLQMLENFAEYEADQITDRTNAGKRTHSHNGEVISSQAPYGYTTVRENNVGRLVVNNLEAIIVKWIFDWYTLEGLSIRAIATQLTDKGIKPRGNSGGKTKRLEGWSIATVRQILNNSTYAGTWYYNKNTKVETVDANGTTIKKQVKRDRSDWIAVSVPAIIDQETFTSAQSKLKSNKENASRNRKRDYLFSGRLTCGCERKVIGDCQRKNGTLYYRCPRRVCSNFYEHELLPVVWDWLTDTVTNIDRVIQTLNDQQAVKELENAPLIQRSKDIEALIGENRAAYKRWGDRFEKGKMSEEEYDERVGRLNAELAGWERERTKLGQQLAKTIYTPEQVTDIVAYCEQIAGGMDKFYRAEKRETLARLQVEGRLAVENGIKVCYVRCVIQPTEKRIMITTSAHRSQNTLVPLIVSARLVIGIAA